MFATFFSVFFNNGTCRITLNINMTGIVTENLFHFLRLTSSLGYSARDYYYSSLLQLLSMYFNRSESDGLFVILGSHCGGLG